MEEQDAVNVAVLTTPNGKNINDNNNNKNKKFLIFRQSKYAIHGQTLSPVGGMIEPGETPFDAAKREVFEELGMISSKQQQKQTQQNQQQQQKQDPVIIKEDGTMDGTIPKNMNNNKTTTKEEYEDYDDSWVYLGSYRTMMNRGGGFIYFYLLKDAVESSTFLQEGGDDEKQDILQLSQEEIIQALKHGEFKEVKWTALMSLAILHLNEEEKEKMNEGKE